MIIISISRGAEEQTLDDNQKLLWSATSPTLHKSCVSLRESIRALNKSHAFLEEGEKIYVNICLPQIGLFYVRDRLSIHLTDIHTTIDSLQRQEKGFPVSSLPLVLALWNIVEIYGKNCVHFQNTIEHLLQPSC